MKRLNISSRPQHLGGLLSYQAQRRPQNEFAIFIDQQRRLTFGEANRLANRFAHGLRRAGIEQHRPVCLMMPNVPEALISEYGTLKLGAIAVEINADFRGPALARMINLTESELLVIDETLVPAVDDLKGELAFLRHVLVSGEDPPRTVAGVPAAPWDSVLSEDESDPEVAIRALDTASIMFTSGTTGVSKGCMLSHRYGIYMAVTTVEALRITSEDCTYTGYPIYHMGAAYSEVLASIVAGSRVAIRRRFSASRFWADVREYGATRFLLQGSVARILETAPPSDSDIDNPVELVWGGPLPRDPEAFERRFGLTLIGCYGLTDAGDPAFADPEDPDRWTSCGPVLPEYTVRIADPDGEPVRAGTVGEILIRSEIPGIMSAGYYGNPQATVDAWRDLWFHSGDLGYLDEDGKLYFVGRIKEMIRRRGENVSEFEVEESLELHPAVAEAAAVGIPSELGEEDVKVYVTLLPGAAVTETELLEHCIQKMARFMVPDAIEMLDAFPRTASGKIAKSQLPRVRSVPASYGSTRLRMESAK
jgi:crotonobetaine/carnitine-CoA ligase